MNYIQQANAFHSYRLYEERLSAGQIALYLSLMEINNKTNWRDYFQVANSTLEQLTGLSKPGVVKARNKLKQLELIDFKPNGQQATSYHLRKLYGDESIRPSTQVSTQDSIRPSTQDSTQVSTPLINKTKPNKTKNNNHDDDAAERSPKNSEEKSDDQLNSSSAINHWQGIYGGLNSVQMEDLQRYRLEFHDELVNEAIDRTARTVTANQRGGAFTYMAKIIKSWQQAGVKTLADVAEADKRHEQTKPKKAYSNGYQRPKTKEIATDWSKKKPAQQSESQEELDAKIDEMMALIDGKSHTETEEKAND